MIRKINKFEITCDKCKMVTMVETTSNYAELPLHWGRVTEGGHGLTNYDRDYEYCFLCLKDEKLKNKKITYRSK